jgi:hypothetical protein
MRRRFAVSDVYRKGYAFSSEEQLHASRELFPSDTKCPECGLLFQTGV